MSAAASASPLFFVERIVRLEKRWPFSLDVPKTGFASDPRKLLEIQGWIVEQRKEIEQLCIVRERDSSTIAELTTGIERPGVLQRFPEVPASLHAGFTGAFHASEPGRYRIDAITAGGNVPVAAICLREPERKPAKLAFIHIAKTAGTSINTFLTACAGSANAAMHVESNPDWRTPVGLAQLRQRAVVGGHIRYFEFESRLDLWEYVTVTVLRRPIEQLISHLAYARHLASPGQEKRLAQHSLHIRDFARLLAATDLGSPRELRRLVRDLSAPQLALIDNCQTRYLSNVKPGQRVTLADLQLATQILPRIDIVGFTEDLDGFCQAVAGRMGWPAPDRVPVENRHASRYGMDASNEAFVRAVWRLIRFDELLYQRARSPADDLQPLVLPLPPRGSARVRIRKPRKPRRRLERDAS